MSRETQGPILRVDGDPGDEEALDKFPQRLSRSPHPYAQHFPDVPFPKTKANGDCNPHLSAVSSAKKDLGSKGIGSIFNEDSHEARKDPVTPSDSGTEADDESGAFLKSLPAPPARLRKGLKNGSAIGTPSPLLTPSYLDDERRRDALEASFKRRSSVQSRASTDEEALSIRDKFRKRRLAELIRRMTETVLLGCIGCIACRKTLLLPVRKEMTIAATIVCGTYFLYPFRLFNHHRWLPFEERASRRFIQIPAAFDPATLLYPVLLPVFIAASLLLPDDIHVKLNLVLGIASMPRAIVPSQDSYSGHTSVQWLLSILSVAYLSKNAAGSAKLDTRLVADPEVFTLLYPLHQALLPTLGYLTTTSLLSTELQLLSVALINVLLLSSSPQALILQAILWGGGLSLLLLCKHILEWEVALARIPSWRFRKDTYDADLHSSVKRLLKGLRRWFSHDVFNHTSEESDTDKPQNLKTMQTQRRSRGFSSGSVNEERPLLKTQTAMPEWSVKLAQTSARRERSSTLPSFTGLMPPNHTSYKDNRPRKTASFLPKPKSFRSLTKGQAAIVKWLYALYTYTVVIVVIAIPIRTYLGKHALHHQEPIGWSLGYLFGDSPTFRGMVAQLGVERWIRLPPSDNAGAGIYGWAEELRWRHLGAANVRLLVSLHCITTIGIGLTIVFRLSGFADVDTRRKVFHGMMVVMFLPTILIDPTFVALALTLVLAVFLLLDLFRASQLPPLSRPLTHFLAPYVDGRDHRGPVVVSHIFLLIGCSIPLWLSLASLERSAISPWQGWEVPTRDLSMISGVVCVGMGDAAASLIGRRYGRRRWCWSGGKSLEGSAAFAAAVTLGLAVARVWLLYGGWKGDSGDSWPVFFCKVVVAASGASLTEAVLTGGNDNVIVPVILWLLVRGLGI
ncbi:MAG: hypothetical protein Q9166_004727 [cf. Caloplaca sp. 2 TL-2023]